MIEDQALFECNETELIEIARRQGLGRIRRGLPKVVLVGIVTGGISPTMEHYAGTMESRARLEQFIWANIARTRSQLPGCDGHCTTYPCTEGRHALCYSGNKSTIR